MEVTNVTLILLGVFTSLLIYHRFFATPNPLVHPLLLGKQSDVGNVRKPGETGVYRSWATGQGSPLTVRPASSLKTVQDIVQNGRSSEATVPRDILNNDMTDESLSKIIHLLPLGLAHLFPLSTSPTSPSPILTLLPASPTTSFPLLLLSLSLPPSSPLVILPSPKYLTSALSQHDQNHPAPALVVIYEDLVDDAIEQVWEDCGKDVGVLIVGQVDGVTSPSATVVDAREKGMNVRYWKEIWTAAEMADKEKKSVPDSHFSDTHSYYYSEPINGATEPTVVKVTHINVTAGIAALLSLFPADKRPTPALRDVVASAVSLNTPIGMTIALASVWSGVGFRMIGDPVPTWDAETGEMSDLETLGNDDKEPRPTILFLNAKYHFNLVKKLQQTLLKHPLGKMMFRNKVSDLAAGHVSRDGLWEKYIWSDFRGGILSGLAGESLRSVIVVGDAPTSETLGLSHTLLGLPTTRVHSSPFSTGPIFVSHYYDVQTPSLPVLKDSLSSAAGEKAHTGPPATNVEVVLKGPGVETDEPGAPFKGRVWIRGPSVLERADGTGQIEGWTDIDEEASVNTNGTFAFQ